MRRRFCARSNSSCIEALETRTLMAATISNVAGSYSGQFTSSVNLHFPNTKATNPKVRTLTLTLTQNSANALTGALSIAGLGNFNIDGHVRGNQFHAILTGDGSGELSGTAKGNKVTLSGDVLDRVKNESITGKFSATASSTATTGNATLDFVALVAGGSNSTGFPITYFTTNSSDGIKFSSLPFKARQTFPRKRVSLNLSVTSDSAQGLLNGNITLGSLSGSFEGISRGREVEIIFSGTGFSGELTAKPSRNQLANGSITALVDGVRVAGTFHSQSLPNGR